ncbi:MAG: FtsW/RodA/SpoVE family cell cycle protein [Clostridia bacterium]|nr:FtsW/RodA/SpoVE family cell cycle protein [Clostridia bacterium]
MFFVALILVLVVGLVSLFSASYAYSYYQNNGDSYAYITKQIGYALVGVLFMFIISFVDYHVLHRWAIPIMIFSWALLLLVLFLPEIQNVHRWIRLGPINIQPSEIAKFAIILLFAHWISHYKEQGMRQASKGFWPFMLVLGFTAALVVVEPHLSGTMLIIFIGMVMMFIGGTRPAPMVGVILLGVAAVVLMVVVFGYEQDRFEVWNDPLKVYMSDKKYGNLTGRDVAWQTVQSLFAIGSGGLMGEGIGNSRQKHLFLPEPQNDFIFAIVCEELGFIGAVLIILLFGFLLWRGFAIGMKAPDKFGSMLAIGLTAQIGLQVALNLAVVTNSMPNTGISLPFFSYGGSSLIMLLMQMGLLLSISRQGNYHAGKR